MSHIKYRLWQEGKVVKFQILWMDERFRRGNKYATSTKMTICSDIHPEINYDAKTLYLQGNSTHANNDIVGNEFGSYQKASKFIADIHQALEEWSNNWEGFKEEVEENKVNQFIYEV